jgi:uncharacterized protein
MFLNRVSDFLMIFIGLLVESLPFVVLGVLISSLIAVFVKPEFILKFKSKNIILSHIQSMFIGVFLPVCECGNIPLAKRLIIIGFKPSEVITFMLAAPILNPLVLISTLEAFNIDKNIAIIRIVSGGVIALLVGLIFSFNNKELAINSAVIDKPKFSFQATASEQTIINNTAHVNFFENFRNEFFSVFKVLALGCILASAFQIFIPRDWISLFATDPLLSVLSMIFLAFLISICSSVDAFFALSLSSTFNLGSILSFLVFGPMIDIKTLFMLRSIYKPFTLIRLVILVMLFCTLLGLGVNYFYKNYY